MRVHAIPQGQLRHPLAVLLPKVVRDGCVVLSSVREGLGTQGGDTQQRHLTEGLVFKEVKNLLQSRRR